MREINSFVGCRRDPAPLNLIVRATWLGCVGSGVSGAFKGGAIAQTTTVS